MIKGNLLNAQLKEETLAIDGVTDVIKKREAFIGKAAVSDDYPVVSDCDILDVESYQEAECAVVQGRMPTTEDEVLIAEIVYEYLGRFANLEIG